MHSSFVNRGHGLGHGFPWYFWTWCIRSSSTHRGPWPNHGFPCAWDEQQCWGHDLRHAFPSPALLFLWDFHYLMLPLWLRTFWTSVSLVSPPAAFPCHQGHGQAVTFPMAVEGHGLACSSHGFPRLGCTACTLIEVRWGVKKTLTCSALFVGAVCPVPPFSIGGLSYFIFPLILMY